VKVSRSLLQDSAVIQLTKYNKRLERVKEKPWVMECDIISARPTTVPCRRWPVRVCKTLSRSYPVLWDPHLIPSLPKSCQRRFVFRREGSSDLGSFLTWDFVCLPLLTSSWVGSVVVSGLRWGLGTDPGLGCVVNCERGSRTESRVQVRASTLYNSCPPLYSLSVKWKIFSFWNWTMMFI